MAGGNLADGLIAGGKPVGVGLVVIAGVKLFMFVFDWISGRYDTRQDRLERREKRMDASYADRLDHLERQVARIPILEVAVNILAAELRQHDPANSKLSEVAKLLRTSAPFAPEPNANLDDLLGKMK